MAVLVGVVDAVDLERRLVRLGSMQLFVPDTLPMDAFIVGTAMLVEFEVIEGVNWVSAAPRQPRPGL